MLRYKNLIIVGTSHIAQESVNFVKDVITTLKPDIIAIELDQLRAKALLSKHKRSLKLKDIKELGVKPYIANLIGARLEKYLAKKVNLEPGAEMKIALQLAKQYKIRVAFIDQDVKITLKRLTSRITFREKLRLLKDLTISPFLKREKIEFDLTKVPSEKTINKLITKLKKDYPSIYLTLIEERNKVLSKNLYNIMTQYPDKLIVAIIGAGHKNEVLGDIKSKFKQ